MMGTIELVRTSVQASALAVLASSGRAVAVQRPVSERAAGPAPVAQEPPKYYWLMVVPSGMELQPGGGGG